MKKSVQLTTSLLLLLAMASFTLIPEITLAVLAVFLAVGLNLIIFRIINPHKGFKVIRQLDKRQITVGENVGVAMNLTFKGSFPIMSELTFGCKTLGLDFNTGPLVLKSSETSTYNYSFVAKRRGAHIISPVELDIKDWLLLTERKLTVTDQEEILILPHIYPLRSDVIAAIGSRIQGLSASSGIGRSSEIWGLKEYHPGDDYRLIAWKTMAKAHDNIPMTKVTVGEVGPSITVLVDIGEDMKEPNGEYSNLDVAADLAASLCFNLIKGQVKTGLIFYDNKFSKVLKPERSSKQLDLILHHLAYVQPSVGKFRIATLAKEFFPTDFGSTFILIVGRLGDVLPSTFVNDLSKMKIHHQIILILIHTEESRHIAENIQTAANSAGVRTLLSTSTSVRETLSSLERIAYEDIW
ncbi:MAG TPA: DUF58 domain-containing protein [Nitrososphaerales archaeon]